MIGNNVPNQALMLTEKITQVELDVITQADIAANGLKRGTVKKEKLDLLKTPWMLNFPKPSIPLPRKANRPSMKLMKKNN